MVPIPNRRPSRPLRAGAISGSAASRRRQAARTSNTPGGLDWARRIELVSVLIASLVAVGGLWYTSVQTQQAASEARQDRALSKEGQVTDRYTTAVNNLADDKEEVRLGSIYALQRIMRDSPRDQPTIANVLAAYLRSHASKRPAKGASSPVDIQAAFAALATRNGQHDNGFRADLRGVWIVNKQSPSPITDGVGQLPTGRVKINLAGADLSDAHLINLTLPNVNLRGAGLVKTDLTHTDLSDADLRQATLDGAQLRGASLVGSDLRGASMTRADLRDASLDSSDFRGVLLSSTDFRRADFGDADLRGASLDGTDLRDVAIDDAKVSVEQLREAKEAPAWLLIGER